MPGRMSLFDRRVGAWIYRMRKARGWTRPELAQRAGLTCGVVTALETARSRMYLDQFLALGDAFYPRGPKG